MKRIEQEKVFENMMKKSEEPDIFKIKPFDKSKSASKI